MIRLCVSATRKRNLRTMISSSRRRSRSWGIGSFRFCARRVRSARATQTAKLLIHDIEAQDMHCGGIAAAALLGERPVRLSSLARNARGQVARMIFAPTGALLSPRRCCKASIPVSATLILSESEVRFKQWTICAFLCGGILCAVGRIF